MDNFHFDVTSNSHLAEIITIAFDGAPGGRAESYRVDQGEGAGRPARLVLGWSEKMRGALPLPFNLRVDDASAFQFVDAWLREQKLDNEPDHDGDNGRAFRIYNESWGKVGGDSYSFVAIEPAWAMFGK